MRRETVVSWLRLRLERTLSNQCWRETQDAFAARLRQCCANIYARLDVEGLCRGVPKRVEKLLANEGGRLKG